MNVYEEKKEFIKKLKPALQAIPYMEDIRYEHFPNKYVEYVCVTFAGDYKEFIDVTGDSLTAILHEVGMLLSGRRPVGTIENLDHRTMLSEWFEEADPAAV